MTFTAHKDRRVFPENLYGPPDEPHHVHLAPCPAGCEEDHEHVGVCVDHRIEACPSTHWSGGHPEPDHPHHVEYDGSTGQWGYTRLSNEEIRDLQQLGAFENERQALEEAKVRQRIDGIRAKAREDPAYAMLVEHLGIRLEA